MSDPLTRLVCLLHLASTLFMAGVIWFVQVVHYPLFDAVGRAGFAAYERRHTALTTYVVGPPMLVEAATAGLLFWFRPPGVPAWPLWAGAVLLAGIWLSTALVQVPCHEALSREFDPAVHLRLVSTNWVRTAAWTLRGLLVLWVAWKVTG
jgi:hypothetical protein